MAKQRPAEDSSRIPVCRSDFLQDVSIELGRRLRAVRYWAKGRELEFYVSVEETDGDSIERFEATRRMYKNASVHVVISETREAYYCFCHSHLNKGKPRYEQYSIVLQNFSAYEAADLVRDSLLDETGVRETWRKLVQKGES